jgi:hypothetical protein
MYENGIDVTYQLVDDEEDSSTFGQFVGSEQRIYGLPGWAAGDPQMALALYLFGHRTMVDLVRIVDWAVTEAPSDDPYCASHGERFDPAEGCGGCLSLPAPTSSAVPLSSYAALYDPENQEPW